MLAKHTMEMMNGWLINEDNMNGWLKNEDCMNRRHNGQY